MQALFTLSKLTSLYPQSVIKDVRKQYHCKKNYTYCGLTTDLSLLHKRIFHFACTALFSRHIVVIIRMVRTCFGFRTIGVKAPHDVC